MTPRLIARTDDLWVVDKPSGWASHPTGDSAIPDVLAWAAEEGDAGDLAPVHRLDRDTSGVLLLSPLPETRAKLGAYFADGDVEKVYLTLVHGRTRLKGVIRRPLHDRRRGRSLPAVTRYRRTQLLGAFSYLTVRPESGRQHQIRRHLHGLGHAVVGDERYRSKRFRAVPAFPGRLWLHAQRLTLPDGRVFEASLPAELARHLVLLADRYTTPEGNGEPERNEEPVRNEEPERNEEPVRNEEPERNEEPDREPDSG